MVLFNCEFFTHEALEDVQAPRILFSPPLELTNKTIVNHGKTSSAKEAQQQSTFLDQQQKIVDTFIVAFGSGLVWLISVYLVTSTASIFICARLIFGQCNNHNLENNVLFSYARETQKKRNSECSYDQSNLRPSNY